MRLLFRLTSERAPKSPLNWKLDSPGRSNAPRTFSGDKAAPPAGAEELRDWVDLMRGLTRRVKLVFAFANNHYAGFGPATVDLFRELWRQNEPESARVSRDKVNDNLKFSF